MRLFHWLSDRPMPAGIDLRQCGWQLAALPADHAGAGLIPGIAHADNLTDRRWSNLGDWRHPPLRKLLLLIGIEDEEARARLLRQGFGDVLGKHTSLREIEARALRVLAQAEMLPRSRQLGKLRLDLFARDGFVGTRPLGLHPREFALIWRLADTPGAVVAKKALVSDVWRMAYVPDTNSLAVHVFRLRSKLAVAGFADLVATAPSGGYFLTPPSSLGTVVPFMLAEADGQEAAAMARSVDQFPAWEP